MISTHPERVTLALTGASGACYGLRLMECLVKADIQVLFLVSRAALVVLETEVGMQLVAPGHEDDQAVIETGLARYFNAREGQIRVFGENDWMAPVASGSGAPSAMVVCPCSMGTLSAVACGISNNLIQRAASVAIKERRQLILVPRESPYSEIHLENMLKLTRMGAVILPASPGFYNRPGSIDELVDFIVARILDQLGVDQQLMPAWGQERL